MNDNLEKFNKYLSSAQIFNLHSFARIKETEVYINLSDVEKNKIENLVKLVLIKEDITEENLSIFLLDVVNKLENGEKYIGGFFDIIKFKEEFSKYLNPTEEEINIRNIEYNKFVDVNSVIIYDHNKLNTVDSLQNNISKFIDNNDPYSFLLYNEDFDINTIVEWNDIVEIYNMVLNNPIIKAKQEIYNKNKEFIINISKNRNKYRIANQLECVDIAIKLYETLNNLLLDKSYLDKVLIPIIDELYLEFDAYDFITKYNIATIKFKEKNLNGFDDMFIEQYCRPYRIKKEVKLF